jgi:hypothetical protein
MSVLFFFIISKSWVNILKFLITSILVIGDIGMLF